MNLNTFLIYTFGLLALLQICESTSSKLPDPDSDDDITAAKEDQVLKGLFESMGNDKSGAAIDLDGVFGKEKCSCVCQNLEEKKA